MRKVCLSSPLFCLSRAPIHQIQGSRIDLLIFLPFLTICLSIYLFFFSQFLTLFPKFVIPAVMLLTSRNSLYFSDSLPLTQTHTFISFCGNLIFIQGLNLFIFLRILFIVSVSIVSVSCIPSACFDSFHIGGLPQVCGYPRLSIRIQSETLKDTESSVCVGLCAVRGRGHARCQRESQL